MNIWTSAEEAENLAKRFQGVNRKEFAAHHSIPGGDNMIYQHITARRPISREAAVAYARAFNCGLEEISPRVAVEVLELAALIGNPSSVVGAATATPSCTLEKLRPESRTLIHAIVDADKHGVSPEALNLLKETLRLLRLPARPARLPPGTFDVEDPSQ